ncbi:MAG: hypothetical protein WAK66_01825, partial [Methylocystis sp.]
MPLTGLEFGAAPESARFPMAARCDRGSNRMARSAGVSLIGSLAVKGRLLLASTRRRKIIAAQ